MVRDIKGIVFSILLSVLSGTTFLVPGTAIPSAHSNHHEAGCHFPVRLPPWAPRDTLFHTSRDKICFLW
jgi:hypothetical protein